jgi:hypothetical protein
MIAADVTRALERLPFNGGGSTALLAIDAEVRDWLVRRPRGR